jgi:ABC-type transport system involved in cytochrome bd biosynthesis fused ATPase/permease subunit
MFILFNKFLYSKVERYGEEFNLSNNLMLKGISEGVSGMKEIRILGKEDFFKKTVSRGIKKMAEMDVKSTLIHTSPRSLLELVMVVFVVIIVFMNFYIQNNLDTVVTVLGVFAVGAVRLIPIVSGLFGSIATIKYGRNSVSNLVKDIESFETEFLPYLMVAIDPKSPLTMGINRTAPTANTPRTVTTVSKLFWM